MKCIIVKTLRDNVGNALEEIKAGETFCWTSGDVKLQLVAETDIPFAFKVAVQAISEGAPVICYGESIGVASAAIRPGELVHIHNVEGKRGNTND